MNTDNIREAFEAIYKERYKDYWEAIDALESMFKTRDEGQRYENMNVQDAWEFFQEITAASEKRIAELEKDDWISVDDRLPDFIEDKDVTENVFCIVNGKVTLGQRQYICDEGWMWACGVGYLFGDLASVEIEGDDDYNVTHWKPLPQPPQAMKDSD